MKPPTDDLDRELAELLRSPDVWQGTQVTLPPRMREMTALSQQLANEEHEAAELLDSLANTPMTWWRTAVLKSPAGRTLSAVRLLLERVRTEVRKSPARALELT